MRVKQWLATAAVALAMMVGLNTPTIAQQPAATVATVVIAPVERTLKDVSWLIEACNVPGVSGFFEIMGENYTTGLDKTKPLGILVSLENGAPKPLVCLPVANAKEFFDKLGEASLQVDDLGDGMYEVGLGPQVFNAKSANGWLYVGQNEEALQNLPKNPAELFGDYHKRYNFTVKIDLQQLPEELKDMAIENLRNGFEGAMAQAQAGKSDEEREAAEEMAELQMAQIEELVRSTQQVVLGWLIDSSKQQIHFDGAVQYVAGSKLAKQMESQAKLKSDFTGLVLPNSSVEFRVTSLATNEEDKKVAKQSMQNSLDQIDAQLENSSLPDEIADAISEFAEGFVGIFEKTIDEGVVDGAASASFTDDSVRILIGGRIADGHSLEAEIKKLVNKLPKTPDVKVEFDAGSYNGFNLHRVSIKVPSKEAKARAVFGDAVKVVVAGGDKAVLVCLDSAGDATIKAAIDSLKSKKGVDVTSPIQAALRLTGILKFAQNLNPNPVLENVIGVLGQYSGKDAIQVNSTVLPRGMVTRVSIDEGILRAIGSGVQAGQAARGGF
ncbi:MAG: hypothetical protein U0930_08945 [Pirellulales bacterium]